MINDWIRIIRVGTHPGANKRASRAISSKLQC